MVRPQPPIKTSVVKEHLAFSFHAQDVSSMWKRAGAWLLGLLSVGLPKLSHSATRMFRFHLSHNRSSPGFYPSPDRVMVPIINVLYRQSNVRRIPGISYVFEGHAQNPLPHAPAFLRYCLAS